ncbi:MAG: M3 family metallopeptidase [Parvibaculaceae bacterium]|nr:M3 family metallopeptidase [Parvibaculaceae bacterium]
MASENPLLFASALPFGMPDFAAVRPEHFRPAFDLGMTEQRAEIAAITGSDEKPGFANTIEALERSGRLLRDVGAVFSNLTGAHTNTALQAVERDMSPLMARHRNAIFLDDALFARIDDLYGRRSQSGLDAEQARVLERYHTAFVRAGAGRPKEVKDRLAAIAERLASLGTQFGQNVLADEESWKLVLEDEADLAGLSPSLRAASARVAADMGLPGKHVITLARSLVEPFLASSARRDLREQAFRAWGARGEAGQTDNRGIITETLALRAERARLLGYENFAAFRLADSMAKTPQAAMNLLRSVWTPARAQALREREALQALVHADGGNFTIAPWDWRFYAERRRKAEFDIDDAEIKPYLQLERMIEAVFYTAHRLFGLVFTPRPDIPAYHPDVRVFEVTDAAGAHAGLFLGDYFARPSKRSGAWMSAFRVQEKLDGDVRPIIVNVMSFSKAAEGEAALISFDDARTLFHEFGHALHGLLSDVTYPLISGTNVARDFVEFPSQLFEHWLEQPEILERFAVHYRTGEPIPRALLDRLLASRTFNQGFATVEYVSSALVDLEMHLLDEPGALDPAAFETKVLENIGMPEGLVMRHRPPHFQHVFAGEGYSSAYYSYLWSEVLDADGFGAFEEAGDVFAPAVAKRLHDFVYAGGNRRDPQDAYEAFRGHAPDPAALLRKRGLVEQSDAA